jgi:hypothetical protein
MNDLKYLLKNRPVTKIDTCELAVNNMVNQGLPLGGSERHFLWTAMFSFTNAIRGVSYTERLITRLENEGLRGFIIVDENGVQYGERGVYETLTFTASEGAEKSWQFIMDYREKYPNIIFNFCDLSHDRYIDFMAHSFVGLTACHRSNRLNIIYLLNRLGVREHTSKFLKVFENSDKIFMIDDFTVDNVII